MLKLGLVFSGGGGKGAYQIGVWKAMDELGLSPFVKGISATSIGAINSILFLNNDLDAAIDFWKNIRRQSIAPIRPDGIFSMLHRGSLSSKEPLRRLLEETINFRYTNRNIEVVVACTEFLWGYPKKRFFKIDYRDEKNTIDIVLASCTVPLLFKVHRIIGENRSYFFDGGIRSRTPVEGLDYDKYDRIIVVHLDSIGKLNPLKYNKKHFINIYPSIFQGGIYNGTYGFTYELASKRIEAGYLDAIKILSPMLNEELKYEF